MRVLLDTNVVLDVLLEREPFLDTAKRIWKATDNGQLTGYIAASTATDIFYLARKQIGSEKAREAVRVCLSAFEICTVDYQTLRLTVALAGRDFEDDLLVACSIMADLDAIITRDKKLTSKDVLIVTPEEILQRVE